jgi:probable HAF family extracellular repeat protein
MSPNLKTAPLCSSSNHSTKLLLLLVMLPAAVQAQFTYTVTDLGTLGSFVYTEARGINASGQVVGSGEATGFVQTAFLYSNGTMTRLGTLPGGLWSYGLGINASGQVVGSSDSTSGTSSADHAFLYSHGTMTDMGTLLPWRYSTALGINAAGQVVGASYDVTNPNSGHAFLYANGTMRDLGVLPGWNSSTAERINDNGQVVGLLYRNGAQDAFLYSNGSMTDLGSGWASDINNNGQVVGYSGALGHAFLYSHGTTVDLGTLGGGSSWGRGINATGQVVGDSLTAANEHHAFLWSSTSGVTQDLNDLIPSGSGWTLQDAWAINDAGQICGNGINPMGQTQAYLLTPILMPPSITTQPLTQTVEAGSAVGLRVKANGTLPLLCLWYLNSTNLLSCSTNCGLNLTNVRFAQSGAYTVVISNVLGAVTSTPAMLNVIAPVERRPVPGVKLTAPVGTSWSLDYRDDLGPTANWETMAVMSLTNAPQFYFDLSAPLPPQRFYRAWQTGTLGVRPSLDLHLVPAITLTGSIGHSVRLDYINQFGPTDAWVTLDTVALTNTTQLYFDISAPGQPPRLYRLSPLAMPFLNLNFDSANPDSTYTSVAAALPSWSAYVGGMPFPSAFYNILPLDGSYVGIIDAKAPASIPKMPTAIAGAYTAYLAAGYGGDTWLTQTGMIPTNAAAMYFYTGNAANWLAVALNGQDLRLYWRSSGPNYQYWGVDVSTFAGKVAEIRFSVAATHPYNPAEGPHVVYLDKITFSSTPLSAISQETGGQLVSPGF